MQDKTPSRDELALLFANPPLDYSEFMTYFWEAGTLSKEQLTWQLEQIREKGVAGSFYYPRYVRGETYGAQPPYWSDGWWELFEHYVAEHERLGMTAWFADWTGQGGWQDKLRAESEHNPELLGHRLVIHEAVAQAGEAIRLDLPTGEDVLAAAAYRTLAGGLDFETCIDLMGQVAAGQLHWEAPDGDWMVTVVCSQPHDLDYLNPAVAERWLEIYWEPHIEHLGQFAGGALGGYLQDEIFVLRGNIVYAESLRRRFQSDKGYDPRSYLVGLFHHIGDFTDKIRCEYYEVMSTLLEENLYKPLSDWHQAHGLQFGTIATWGRQCMLGQTYHYGDIFRLCRWFHVTGNEDPGAAEPGGRCFADAKLSSSVLHLYERDRAGMCGYWGSGHGMTQEQNLAWTNENYAYGLNMYNTHGGLYGSLGSWYEWVPPSVHFRQPYWTHWQQFTGYVSRLSAVLSQGVHRADVALLYPLSTIHANWLKGDHFTAAADETAIQAMALAQQVYAKGIDFDFIDDLKLNEAKVADGKLHVGKLEFRVVLLPPMTTIQTASLEKLKAFYDAGGTVVAVQRLPGGSAEHGGRDPHIRELLAELFGVPASAEYIHTSVQHQQAQGSVKVQSNAAGGRAVFVPSHQVHRNFYYDPGINRSVDDVPAFISRAIEQDMIASGSDIFHTHQKIDTLDVYFLYNVRAEKRTIEFDFRVAGDPEIWDAFSGRIVPHHRFERIGGRTKVRLEMERHEGILLVFGADARPQVVHDNLERIVDVQTGPDGLLVAGRCADGGRKQVRIQHGAQTYVGEVRLEPPPPPMSLAGDWHFELLPTMDNRWSDWRWPATDTMIGPEARIFRYRQETVGNGTELGWHQADFDDVTWQETIWSFGPYWHCLGPFADGQEPDSSLFIDGAFDIAAPCEAAGKTHHWREHVYSQTVGHAGKEVYSGHGGLHGIDDHFIYFPATGEDTDAWCYLFTSVRVPEAGDWEFHFGHGAIGQDQHESLWEYNLGGAGGAGQQAWINGRQVLKFGAEETAAVVTVKLAAGLNPVLLKLLHYQGQAINIFAAFQDPAAAAADDLPPPPQLKWFASGTTPVHDISPQATDRVGWYRFEAPAGTRSMKLALEAEAAEAWVNGVPVNCERQENETCIELASPVERVARIALRLQQKPGCYAGAAIMAPVEFTCAPTRLPLGDWCNYALDSYSGGAVYGTGFNLTAAHADTEIVLDLGQVQVSAEVEVNGEVVGIGLGRPYRFDITDYVCQGQNQLKVTVFNTLANHYDVAFPSSYVFDGQTVSGLLGPVELRFLARVNLTARASAERH